MDNVSKGVRSVNMRNIKGKNTKPELAVRKLISSMGLRYRIHSKHLPGKPDIVFPNKRKVIFVNGCFWHQHKSKRCKSVHMPKSRLNYWIPKLKRTVVRDKISRKTLLSLGWKYLDVWECTINTTSLKKKIHDFIVSA